MTLAFASSGVVSQKSCASPAAHLLDFRIGTWDYRAQGYDPGQTVVSRESSGCALFERYVDINGGHSTSLFMFDTTDATWHVTTDDPSGRSVMTGRPEKNGIAFYHSATDREVYLPRDHDHAVFIGERSTDGGKTWVEWVSATYTRVAPPNGTSRPGDQPEMLGPGVVSTRDYERDEALSPDGRTLYFTKRTIWPYFSVVCVSHLVNGTWTEPEVAPFSGRYPDATPAFAPNGNTLYFASRRPAEASGTLRRDYDLWAMDRSGEGWSEPRHLPAPVNTSGNELSPSLTTAGALYFVTDAQLPRVVRAEPNAGGWSQPSVVAVPADSAGYELGVSVSTDDRYMVVTVLGRDDALGTAEGVYQRGDLYVRERRDGKWSELRHLSAPINTAAEEGSPSLTSDGRLLFTSERGGFTEHGPHKRTTREFEDALHSPGNGLGDIYAVSVSALGVSR